MYIYYYESSKAFQLYVEDLTRVIISYEIIKRAFGDFNKFDMK